MEKKKKVVVAFSGGLDTSFTVMYLAKEKGRNRFIIYNEEIHGSIQDNGRHIHKILDLSEHSEYMSGVVSDMILDLMSRGKDAIEDVTRNIMEQFEIDGI